LLLSTNLRNESKIEDPMNNNGKVDPNLIHTNSLIALILSNFGWTEVRENTDKATFAQTLVNRAIIHNIDT